MQQPPKKPAKRKNLGLGINWTNSDLDILAEVTPDDLKAAEQLWQKDAPAPLKNLLQAEVQEDK